MNHDTFVAWLPVIHALASLGVKSYGVIRAALQDAGADDATIAALQPRWDALFLDVQRASRPPSA